MPNRPFFKCCTCGKEIEQFEEANFHMIPDKSKNYERHHVVPKETCDWCPASDCRDNKINVCWERDNNEDIRS